ncbi:MAG: hypothetical protein WAX38_02485 [Minisyncoccia bacterium]
MNALESVKKMFSDANQSVDSAPWLVSAGELVFGQTFAIAYPFLHNILFPDFQADDFTYQYAMTLFATFLMGTGFHRLATSFFRREDTIGAGNADLSKASAVASANEQSTVHQTVVNGPIESIFFGPVSSGIGSLSAEPEAFKVSGRRSYIIEKMPQIYSYNSSITSYKSACGCVDRKDYVSAISFLGEIARKECLLPTSESLNKFKDLINGYNKLESHKELTEHVFNKIDEQMYSLILESEHEENNQYGN